MRPSAAKPPALSFKAYYETEEDKVVVKDDQVDTLVMPSWVSYTWPFFPVSLTT